MKNVRLTATAGVIFLAWGMASPRAHDSYETEERETMSYRAFQECKKNMDKDFQELTSVRRIERECGLSMTGVSRLFQRYAHESPFQYLERLKENQAAGMLRQNNESGRGKQSSS
jgi:transcriptional regulator GlxA family with amidase domain